MPRKKDPNTSPDPILHLKALALRDDPDVHAYRDIHYQLVIDSLQATGQRIASEEYIAPLSVARRKSLMKKHVSLSAKICKKYWIGQFGGGDPYIVKKKDWLPTLSVSTDKLLRIQTNWKTSFSPRVQFYIPPTNAQAFPSERGTLYQLPPLPKRPLASPPIMTLYVDLSQVKRNSLADLANEFKRAVTRCLDELPKNLRKPSSTWPKNIERDYSRFRLHQQGMSFRWIAYQEKTGKAPSGPVTGPIPTESSVRESVERVHLKLYRKDYSPRRHKSSLKEAPLKQICDTFICAEHGRDNCPLTCKHAQALMKKVDQLLK